MTAEMNRFAFKKSELQCEESAKFHQFNGTLFCCWKTVNQE